MLTRYFLLANILFTSFSICQTQDTTLYFYHGKHYGSEANFSPLRTIINGGFGIMQISNRSNDLRTVDFGKGLKNVTYNLSHPFETISTFGWKKFLTRQVIPTSVFNLVSCLTKKIAKLLDYSGPLISSTNNPYLSLSSSVGIRKSDSPISVLSKAT